MLSLWSWCIINIHISTTSSGSGSSNWKYHYYYGPNHAYCVLSVSDKFSENINTVANEPSLAFFRIQEHVRKTLPQLVEQKVRLFREFLCHYQCLRLLTRILVKLLMLQDGFLRSLA